MSESSPITKNYTQFYARQSRPVGDLGRLALAAPALLLFVLVVILVFLRSPWYVWAYIALLWLVAVWGFQRLRTALAVTSAAVAHLDQTASYLGNQPTRDQFLEFLRDKSSPDDLSNVPEAILSLSSGQMSGESIRVAANTSFTHPTSELNFAAYVRNAMVLGGLFGTVLFFALELGGTAFQEGNLGELLPGLRGALASTLTGILGSLSLGLVATRIEHHLAQLVWETEAFISGPVAAALATAPQKRSLRSEADLWEALREEVARMVDGTAEAYGRLGNDIHGHVKGLEELRRQIGDMPAVQLPPELARLGTVIDQFTHGTDVLAKTSRVLVEAVGALGVFAPARLLSDVEQLATASAERDTALTSGMTTLAARVSALGSRVDDIHQRVGVPDRLWESLAALDAATRRNGEQIAALAEEVRGKQDVGAVTEAVQQAVASVQSLEGGLATFRGEVSSEVDRLASASSALDGSAAGVRSAVDQLSGLTATMATAAPELQKQAARLADTIDRTQQQEKTLQRVESRLRPLEGVYAWHERAMRAPLMRLLTLPLWPAGGLRSLFGGREPEPPVRIVRREASAAPSVAADRQLGPPPSPAPAPASVGSADAPRLEPISVFQHLYARWCTGGERPVSTDTFEVVPLRFAGQELLNEYSAPIPVFEDHSLAGEFVRFSSPGSSEGIAFPNPHAYYNDAVHRLLFPQLTEASYTPHLLSVISPVALRKRADGKWQKKVWQPTSRP